VDGPVAAGGDRLTDGPTGVRGAGRAFCAGFDFGGGSHHWDEGLTTGKPLSGSEAAEVDLINRDA
jgi:hypothetical protein